MSHPALTVSSETFTRLTRYGLNHHTWALALQCTKNLSGIHLSDVLTLHLYCCTSYQLFLLDTVTNNYHFIKLSIVFLQGDAEG